MGEGGTQSNKVHQFALNDVSVSTVLSKIVAIFFVNSLRYLGMIKLSLLKTGNFFKIPFCCKLLFCTFPLVMLC